MPQNPNILISGASIAGPALAYWLRRYGFHPTVIERAPEPRTGGQAIDIRGTARDVVDRMGILADIRAAHTGVRGMAYVDSDNRRVVEMPTELFGDSGGIIADLEILRGDLVGILHNATRTGVEYRFDDSITQLATENDGVRVHFAHSAPRTFDLVVGADGVHSNVRRLAFGPESELVRDLGYHYAIYRTTTRLDLAGWELGYNAPGGRMTLLYPLGDRQAVAMFFFRGNGTTEPDRDPEAHKRLVANTFADAGWEVARLLDGMWDAPDFYFDRPGRVTLDEWSRDRTVLLGDAVFGGSVGLGTSMALVGAYVLAGELAAAGGDHRIAFPRYQAEMRDYVARCRRPMPGGVRGMLPATARGIRLRNRMMRMMLAMPWRNALMGGMDKTANLVTPRDYPDHRQLTGSAS